MERYTSGVRGIASFCLTNCWYCMWSKATSCRAGLPNQKKQNPFATKFRLQYRPAFFKLNWVCRADSGRTVSFFEILAARANPRRHARKRTADHSRHTDAQRQTSRSRPHRHCKYVRRRCCCVALAELQQPGASSCRALRRVLPERHDTEADTQAAAERVRQLCLPGSEAEWWADRLEEETAKLRPTLSRRSLFLCFWLG